MDSGSGDALLAPVLNPYDAQTTWGKAAARHRVVQIGGSPLLLDGVKSTPLGLPSQPLAGTPTLSRVVYARTAVQVRGVLTPVTYLLLIDADDRPLAVLGHSDPQYAAMNEDDLERVWPRSGFATLEGHGVIVEELRLRDIDALAKRYPGTVSRPQLLTASSASWWYLIAALVLIFLVAALSSWLRT